MSDSRVPGWVWVTTPTLAIVFVGFILYLNTLPSSDELGAVKGEARSALQQGLDRAREKVQQEAEDMLSEQSEPAYDFYRLLEEQEVEVPEVDAYVSTPRDAEVDYQYILQAGSFRSESDADEMRASLLLLGLDAYQEAATVNGSHWVRVYVGPFTNRSRLNKAQDILVSHNISPLLLKKSLPAPDGQ